MLESPASQRRVYRRTPPNRPPYIDGASGQHDTTFAAQRTPLGLRAAGFAPHPDGCRSGACRPVQTSA
jgi:hypothetical protein